MVMMMMMSTVSITKVLSMIKVLSMSTLHAGS